MWETYSKYSIKHSSGLVLEQLFYYDAHRRKWLYYFVTLPYAIENKLLEPQILDSSTDKEKHVHLCKCKKLAIEYALERVRLIEKKLLDAG